MTNNTALQNYRDHLLARLKEKQSRINAGGEAAKHHSQNDLKRIEFALQRIDEGTFGMCMHCGTAIQAERLQIIPETVFCKPCADTQQH